MAYGTPDSLDDVEPYYTHIRHGRIPSPDQIEELRSRYALVGGRTPLSRISEATRAGLEARLNEPGEGYSVVLGMKHWRPWIRDAVQALAEQGIDNAVGLVLAPHYSSMSIADYYRYVAEAQANVGSNIRIDRIDSWHLHPPYLQSVAGRIRRRLLEFPSGQRVVVVFTAHSLPARILEHADRYPDQLRESSQAIAALLDLSEWTFSYQSAGRTAEQWLGPDLFATIGKLADQGAKNILVAPIGFVSDHLEILYDIDYEARRAAEDLGLVLKRTESLNASPDFVEGLAELVLSRASAPDSAPRHGGWSENVTGAQR